jgi:hypothetical protein
MPLDAFRQWKKTATSKQLYAIEPEADGHGRLSKTLGLAERPRKSQSGHVPPNRCVPR